MRQTFKKVHFLFTKQLPITAVIPADLHVDYLKHIAVRFSQTELEDVLFSSTPPWSHTWSTESLDLPAETRNESSILADKNTYVVDDTYTTLVFSKDATWWVATDDEITYERQHEANPAQLEFLWP